MKKECKVCGKEFECANASLTCSEMCKKEYRAEANRVNTRNYTMKLKNEFFEHYGSQCSLCGETNKDLLTIGHIHNDGRAHRILVGDSTGSVLRDLKNRGWPEDIVQIECFNCQARKKITGQSINNGESKMSILRRDAIEKLGGKCVLCGETDITVLEISSGIKNGDDYDTKRVELIKNINNGKAKAEVLCANCNCRQRYSGIREKTISKNQYVTVKMLEKVN